MLRTDVVELDCQANGNQGVTQEVSVPEALISTICQKHNFCVKVTKHNLEGKSRSLTVTKILPLDTPAATEYSEETFETGINVCEASKVSVDSAEGIKRTCCIDEMGKAKCLKDSSSRLKRRIKVSSASPLRTDTEITIGSVYEALINAKLQPTAKLHNLTLTRRLNINLALPEVYMSAKEWNHLKYNRVASVAMTNYKTLFEKHDSERFREFLEDVKSGKKKMAAGALLPHKIISQLSDDGEVGAEVAELQWARMVEDVAKKGKMKNSLAVCDVSGSMAGVPMEVCVALGLLVSELNEEPWKGKVITFSENPQLHLVTGSSLREKTKFITEMDWGMNTDFQKVFDRILEVAVENNLSNDQMIKRLFVFSDMEFDSAVHTENSDMDSDSEVDYYSAPYEERLNIAKERSKKKWETDYEVVQRKYKENGFENVPEIVFWNLRDSSATPVAAKQKGVALVSGFSKNLLNLFLEEGGIVNPEDVMWLAIKGEEYKKLVVHD
ncbi:uncharacterized protein LOC125590549 [Brassica napus]|uniref:uncharacterized protein LOC125590549 n=1 Tax=Brassica napus TaxID=3708 RepID=UPI0020796662|nr:uncharacterized protein LOC125590549 [Brassica napus]